VTTTVVGKIVVKERAARKLAMKEARVRNASPWTSLPERRAAMVSD
jgi:hypothetical protein